MFKQSDLKLDFNIFQRMLLGGGLTIQVVRSGTFERPNVLAVMSRHVPCPDSFLRF